MSKRQDTGDLKVNGMVINKQMIKDIFNNWSDIEIFKDNINSLSDRGIKELVNDYKKILTEKIIKGDIPKEESSIIEEYINEKVKHYEDNLKNNWRFKKMNKSMLELRGTLTKYNSILYYLLSGKYPELDELLKENKELKDKCDRLRKEVFEKEILSKIGDDSEVEK